MKSLFQHHLLQTNDFSPKLHIVRDQYWISSLLIIIFILFVWLKIVYGKKFKQILNAFIANRAVSQLLREEQALSNRVSVFLTVIFVLVGSLFMYQIDLFYGWHLLASLGYIYYLKLCLLITVVYFIKVQTVKLLGFIFKTHNQASEYIFNIFLFNKMAGLFLLPIVICLAFMKVISPVFFIYAGVALLALLFLYRCARGLIIAFSNSKISKFYLFVYLCTLEILPLIVLMKAFSGKISILN